jgi:hypothetical protein
MTPPPANTHFYSAFLSAPDEFWNGVIVRIVDHEEPSFLAAASLTGAFHQLIFRSGRGSLLK